MALLWERLANIPREKSFHAKKPSQLNRNEFLIPIGNNVNSISSLITYNSANEKYNTFIKFDPVIRTNLNNTAIDTVNNKLYIPGDAGISEIDLLTKTKTLVSNKDFGYDTPTMVIQNKLHIFSLDYDKVMNDNKHGSRSIHAMYDIKSSEMTITSPTLPSAIENKADFSEGEAMVYLKTENKCIFIGGDFGLNVVVYDLDINEWSVMKQLTLSDTWLYERPGFIVTNDDRYLITFVPFDATVYYEQYADEPYIEQTASYDSEIQIIDLKNKITMISLVKLPSEWKQEWIYAVLTNDYNKDGIIIYGYLRESLNQTGSIIDVNEFPKELIMVISNFYSCEYVHIVNSDTGHHWRILLDVILSNVTGHQ